MRHTSLALYAARVDTLTPSDRDGRRVSGLLVPYGQVGHTSVGPVMVPGPGRIEWPEDLSRVKLVTEHPTLGPVGYLTAIRDTPEGLRAEFYVAATPAGDDLLLEASERVRDAFSVEMYDLDLTPAGELVHGRLKAVAMPPVPAWADSREDGLAASHHTEEGTTTMTEEQRARLTELLAIPQADRTEEQASELRDLVALAETDAGTEETEETEDPPAGSGTELEAGHRQRRPTRIPAHLGTGTRRRSSGRPIAELYAAMANVLSGRSRPELEAALSDITGTANIWTAQDEYAGQLWGGVEYTRRYVPLMLNGPLNSYKGTGWKWTTKPEVADYAGDKAAVTSNVPVTVAVNWTAARLAGAHDIDRKYFDFGDRDFIEAYYQAMRESYAIKSDDKARAFILANATAAGAAGLTIYHAAAKASQAVFDATGGRTPDYLLVNSADVFGLLDTPASDQPDPRILEMFGVTPEKFMPTTGVAAGTVVAGIREASMFRELSGSPIRVEAINIANGGVDGGLFGYYATQETFDGGIQSATFDATP